MAAETTQKAAAVQADRFTIHKKPCSWKDSLGRVVPGEHGTTTQYGRALRVGARPCAKCRAANTAKDMAWRQANPTKKSGTGKPKGNVVDALPKMREKAKAGTPGARTAKGGAVKARKVG